MEVVEIREGVNTTRILPADLHQLEVFGAHNTTRRFVKNINVNITKDNQLISEGSETQLVLT